jgi:23S rRNA-/tRNA-specific pseudouridylate synthase
MNSQNSNRLETTFASGTRADNATVDSPMHMNSQTIDDSSMIAFCEVELELITGRTHQCRGQLQALGMSVRTLGIQIPGSNLCRWCRSDC